MNAKKTHKELVDLNIIKVIQSFRQDEEDAMYECKKVSDYIPILKGMINYVHYNLEQRLADGEDTPETLIDYTVARLMLATLDSAMDLTDRMQEELKKAPIEISGKDTELQIKFVK